LLNKLSVPPPITISIIPSPLRSDERGDEKVQIESVKDSQFWALLKIDKKKNKNINIRFIRIILLV
jgi:hypothetical protein